MITMACKRQKKGSIPLPISQTPWTVAFLNPKLRGAESLSKKVRPGAVQGQGSAQANWLLQRKGQLSPQSCFCGRIGHHVPLAKVLQQEAPDHLTNLGLAKVAGRVRNEVVRPRA